MRMTLNWEVDDLRVLVLVAEEGSIGKAAGLLGVSQPSASRRIAALERRWRLPLLERSTRGASLTPTGQVVVDWATSLLARIDEFDRSLEVLRDTHKPTVRAGVSMTIAEHHAPRWVSALNRRHPEITVTLRVHNSTRVAELVQDGAVDVGFVESVYVPPTLGRQQIGWDRLVVAVRPDHPWADPGHVVSAADLSNAPLVVREQGSGTRETLEQALRQLELSLTPALEMASNTALKSAALAGLGPVVLSRTALAQEIASGQLVVVEVAGIGLRRPLTAIWRPHGGPSPAVQALVGVAATM